MSERTDEEVSYEIQDIINVMIAPAVAQHGGRINFISFKEGHLKVEMSGACSGCAGAKMTLQGGVDNILREHVPEYKTLEAVDDPNSGVQPFFRG
jgi:Fe-S cluster biogenesis protein NfuA